MSQKQPAPVVISPAADGNYDRLIAQFIDIAAAILITTCTTKQDDGAAAQQSQKAA